MDSVLDEAHQLQNGLVARATGGDFEIRDYHKLRSNLKNNIGTQSLVPDFVRRCQNQDQFWTWIKRDKHTYQERRDVIWNAFPPLIEGLEQGSITPSDTTISDQLAAFLAATKNAQDK